MSISSLLVAGLKGGQWVWNDTYNELQFISLTQEKKQKKRKEKKSWLPFNGLTYVAMKVDLKFKTVVSDLELMEFRHFLKRLHVGREDSIVTIQDCKIVAIFLCVQQLPSLFHKFYNLPSFNYLLRTCIVYIQFYLQTCETIVKTQHFLRVSEKTSPYKAMKKDLEDLRVLIGRFYAAVIFSHVDGTSITKTDEIVLYECFLRVSAMVVWIALERKYLKVIKIELERIFRTGHFNNFATTDSKTLLQLVKSENQVILDGKVAVDKKQSKATSRLFSNSVIVHNFIRMDEPKLLMIGTKDCDILKDDRLTFLTKYIFLPETEIMQEGVIIGILGFQRRLFDPLLYPCSKRVLKLLITSSPMDVSLERKKLREIAIKTAQRESEPQPPHIFDELPRIPKPNQFTEKVVEEEASVKTESVHSKKAEDEDEDEDEKENEFEDESDEFEEDSEEESWTEEET